MPEGVDIPIEEVMMPWLAKVHVNDEVYAKWRSAIKGHVDAVVAPLTFVERGHLCQRVVDEVFGFGPLGSLLRPL